MRASDIVVTVILLSVSLPGALFGTLAAIGYWRHRKTLNRSFCLLTISASLYDDFFFSATIFWSAPLTAIGNVSTSVTEGFWGHRMGHLASLGWYGSCFHLAVLAGNRLCAVVRPFRYREIFSEKNTKILLILVNGFSVLFTGYLFLGNYGCGFSYFIDDYAWKYHDTPCSSIWYNYIGQPVSAMLPVLTLSFIIATVLCMSRRKNSFTPRSKTRRRELYLFIISSVNVLMYLLTHLLWVISQYCFRLSRIQKFFTRHFIWTLCHTSNGIASFALMRRIRKTALECIRCKMFKKDAGEKMMSMKKKSIKIPKCRSTVVVRKMNTAPTIKLSHSFSA